MQTSKAERVYEIRALGRCDSETHSERTDVDVLLTDTVTATCETSAQAKFVQQVKDAGWSLSYPIQVRLQSATQEK